MLEKVRNGSSRVAPRLSRFISLALCSPPLVAVNQDFQSLHHLLLRLVALQESLLSGGQTRELCAETLVALA